MHGEKKIIVFGKNTPEIITVKIIMGSTPTVREDGCIGYRLPNGKLHRENGPARKYPNGAKFWYFNGLSHREGGPAREWADGCRHWIQKGLLHNEDGPAKIDAYGNKWWFINGKELWETEFNAWRKENNSIR